ncbi:MAG: Transcriptional regulatory protein SrrA [Firmicutes bacterium ADurb.Bin153]|nr:MAG: Transcriptional regulatory protein SrrA [Firmicutes bacterium ADurb.Bin153]
MEKVLLIEDDKQIRQLLPRYFAREGMEMSTAPTGYEGLDMIFESRPSLVILDVNLPDIDGWSILTRLRKGQDKDLPVIMLTGRSDVPDRLMGLDLGADDYIVKPFEPLEVVARVKAVLRRAGGASRQEGTIEFEGLALDIHGRMVTRNGKEVPLTAKEFDVLAELAGMPGKVVPRARLYEKAWGEEAVFDDHTLEVHINRIRTKLEAGDGMSYITTVRGIGYKFEVVKDER